MFDVLISQVIPLFLTEPPHVQSDSVGIQGWIPITTVPRIPGRDFSGEVVNVFDDTAKDWVGKEVWGTGGARGFAFDGSYAE